LGWEVSRDNRCRGRRIGLDIVVVVVAAAVAVRSRGEGKGCMVGRACMRRVKEPMSRGGGNSRGEGKGCMVGRACMRRVKEPMRMRLMVARAMCSDWAQHTSHIIHHTMERQR
jgi:hypothetical protein